MPNNYYKNPEILYVSKVKQAFSDFHAVCGEGTDKYKELKGVSIGIKVENKINKLKIGEVSKINSDTNRYGSKLQLIAYLLHKEKEFEVEFEVDIKKGLDLIKTNAVKGEFIYGNFVILNQGNRTVIEEVGSQEYTKHLQEIENTKIKKDKELKVKNSQFEEGKLYTYRKSNVQIVYKYLGYKYITKPKISNKFYNENRTRNVITLNKSDYLSNINYLVANFFKEVFFECTTPSKQHIFEKVGFVCNEEENKNYSKFMYERSPLILTIKNLSKAVVSHDIKEIDNTFEYLNTQNAEYNVNTYKMNINSIWKTPETEYKLLKEKKNQLKMDIRMFIKTVISEEKENVRKPTQEELKLYAIVTQYIFNYDEFTVF